MKRREGKGGRGEGADIEGRLGTQGDFCSLKQLLEETSLLFCFLLTPFLLFVLAKDMYKNVFWYVFSLGLYQNISFVSVHGTFFTSCLYKLVQLSDHVGDQRRHNLWTYLSQHLMLAWHVYFFTRWNFLWFVFRTSKVGFFLRGEVTNNATLLEINNEKWISSNGSEHLSACNGTDEMENALIRYQRSSRGICTLSKKSLI